MTQKQLLNDLTRKYTAFWSFDALLSADDYFPSLNVGIPEVLELADGYDKAQENRMSSLRAFRWSYPQVEEAVLF